jgi:predicted ATPase/class 3 adenylate cyclase/transcriptional regulator with XRE-family HTH domain/Tfp pilus assembly protein PilF
MATSDQLPSGILTFLFTDVEGSTKLWRRQPRSMQAALERHDQLIEEIARQHNGVLVRPRGEGDSRFVVFPRATAAVAAAAEIQLALNREPWSTDVPLRVRIALHTGEADLRAHDYYGPAVNHCARLRSIAHAGQVLVSAVTAGLVQESLDADVSLRSLGEHLLKDMEQPEHVWQLGHPDLPDDFPPLNSVYQPTRGAQFGKVLRRYRLASGLTQDALADKAGLSLRGVSDLERGLRSAPHPESVRRLANALGLQGHDRAALLRSAGHEPVSLAPVRDTERVTASGVSSETPRGFGSVLRELRMAAGFSQEQLAQRSGLSRRGVADLERGARNFPHGDTVRRLTEALGLSATQSQALLQSAQRTIERSSVSRYMLPGEASELIGREHETGEVQLVLRSGRLVTLTGPGGIGKTRLALEVARRVEVEYDNGAAYVDLAPVTNSADVSRAVVQALGLQEERNRSLLETVQDYLGVRQVLIVLDNCEHVLDGSARVTDTLVRNCREVRILATSREPMRIKSELAWPVPPLRMQGACELFIERARAAHAGLHLSDAERILVGQICQQLDGMPLAIELAAARVPTLALPQIAARLSERLRLLSGGNRLESPRHQTLRGAIDWSYALLSNREKSIFGQLSVFSGGWDLAAAEYVCAMQTVESGETLDVLTELVRKSLVIAEHGTAEVRYRLLETIREYAAERLQASDGDVEARRRHLAHYQHMADLGAVTRRGVRYPADIQVLHREHNNIGAALNNALALGELEDGLALCRAMGGFWVSQGFLNEGEKWFEKFLARPEDVNWEVVADGFFTAGRIAEYRGMFERARDLHERSLHIARQHQDLARAARALYGRGDAALHQGNYKVAELYLEEGLALGRTVAVSSDFAEALMSLASIAEARGDDERANLLLEEAARIQRQLGDIWGVAFVLNDLGQRARRQGLLHRAQSLHEESHALWRESGSRMGERAALMNLTLIALEQHRLDRAAESARAALVLSRDIADASATTARCLEIAAEVLLACHSPELAVRLLSTATAQRDMLGAPVPPSEQAEHEKMLRTLRQSVSADQYERAWTNGLQLPIEEAVELAARAIAALAEQATTASGVSRASAHSSR